MKIKCVIISDTHGCRDYLRRVLRLNRDADAVIFLGDGVADLDSALDECPSVFAVRGNCDISPTLRGMPLNALERITLGGKRIVITHGHLWGVKGGLGGLLSLARAEDADIILYGHTHIPREDFLSGIYLFNPGSLSCSLGAAPSFGLMTIDEDTGGVLLSHGTIC